MVLKPLKIIPPWYVLLDYFTTRPSFKNLNAPFFDQVAIDAKNVFLLLLLLRLQSIYIENVYFGPEARNWITT